MIEKGIARTITLTMRDSTTGQPKTTLIAGDVTVKISKNGGAFAATTNSPVAIQDTGVNTGEFSLLLTATEMTADAIVIKATATACIEVRAKVATEANYTATKAGYITGTLALDSTVAKEATLNKEAYRLFSLIESQRGTHTGKGNLFFWNPVGGNDSNDGLTPATAKLTFTGVNALVTAYAHDIIILLPGGGGQTVITEKINLNKAFTFLRGPGRDVKFKPTTAGASTVIISAEGVEFSGAIVETHTTGSADAVEITADFSRIRAWVDYSRGHGIRLNNCNHATIFDYTVQDSAQGGSGRGILIDGTGTGAKRNLIYNGKMVGNAGNAIEIRGANAQHNFILGGDRGLIIEGSGGYAIVETDGADYNYVEGPLLLSENNTSGISLAGAHSKTMNVEQWAKESTPKVNIMSATKGAIQVSYAKTGGTVEVVKGDTISIPYGPLGKDITGRKVYFAAKQLLSDSTYKIAVKEITAQITDVATFTGTIPLTSAELNLAAGNYYAEMESRASDGTSTPVTELKFILKVVDQVIG